MKAQHCTGHADCNHPTIFSSASIAHITAHRRPFDSAKHHFKQQLLRQLLCATPCNCDPTSNCFSNTWLFLFLFSSAGLSVTSFDNADATYNTDRFNCSLTNILTVSSVISAPSRIIPAAFFEIRATPSDSNQTAISIPFTSTAYYNDDNRQLHDHLVPSSVIPLTRAPLLGHFVGSAGSFRRSLDTSLLRSPTYCIYRSFYQESHSVIHIQGRRRTIDWQIRITSTNIQQSSPTVDISSVNSSFVLPPSHPENSNGSNNLNRVP
eukprot:jgi/Psemu1/49188/gm1.49188_g